MNAKKRMGPVEVAFVEPRIKFYIVFGYLYSVWKLLIIIHNLFSKYLDTDIGKFGTSFMIRAWQQDSICIQGTKWNIYIIKFLSCNKPLITHKICCSIKKRAPLALVPIK